MSAAARAASERPVEQSARRGGAGSDINGEGRFAAKCPDVGPHEPLWSAYAFDQERRSLIVTDFGSYTDQLRQRAARKLDSPTFSQRSGPAGLELQETRGHFPKCFLHSHQACL